MARVIFVNRFFFPDQSATSQLLTDLAIALAGRDWQVDVVTSRQRIGDAGAALPSSEVVSGVTVHRVRTSTFGRGSIVGRAVDYLTFYSSAGWRLLRIARRGDVVVAKTDPPVISIVVAVVAKLRGLVLVNWLHDLFPEVAERLGVAGVRGPVAGGVRALRNWSLRVATTNVTLGEGMAGALRDLRIAPDAVRVIHNWCDGQEITPLARDGHPLRDEWRLGDDFVVAYSGNLGRVHEFDTLLGAMEGLRGARGTRFLIIGDGARRPDLEAQVQRLELDNVRFLPPQPRVRLGLSLTVADVHVVVLRPELEGLVVPSKFYGIAAAGRPVLFIGDPGGEIARLVAAADCGVAVRTGDSEGLVEVIARLASDPAECRRLGANARRAFEERFDMARAVASWQAVLHEAWDSVPASARPGGVHEQSG